MNIHKQRKKRGKKYAKGKVLFWLFILSICFAIITPVYYSTTKGIATNSNIYSNSKESPWYLILVNKWNYIPTDYKPELTELSNGELVDTRIYPALQKMFDSARKENIYPVVASGYRTKKQQQKLLDEKINDYQNQGYSLKNTKRKAKSWVALPGTSEHQLGLSVDINGDNIYSTSNEVYKWLNENADKYGIIRRYLPNKTNITGVINEPWHYRYVGINAATEIKNKGICLEEYLDKTNCP